MAASPNPLNSTFAGCRGRAVTGSVRFSLWFFSCTRDYLFLAVPSPRLTSRAAAALPFASPRAAGMAAAGLPRGSAAREEAGPWAQDGCSPGERPPLPQPGSLASKRLLRARGASGLLRGRLSPAPQGREHLGCPLRPPSPPGRRLSKKE